MSITTFLDTLSPTLGASLGARVRRWAIARRTEAALRAADAHTLSDIGVAPGDIRAKAWEQAWRDVPAARRSPRTERPVALHGRRAGSAA
jgi:uncharacterized protein YjiS (DUF1127 family)